MKLVKFKDGTYGIRRGFLFKEFYYSISYSSVPNFYLWTDSSQYWRVSKEEATEVLNGLTKDRERKSDAGTPVKQCVCCENGECEFIGENW